MSKPHVLVIVTDGVSLRNFAYTSFYKKAIQAGYKVTFWNGTSFDLSNLGYDSIPLKSAKIHPLTSVFKNARKHVELNCFTKRKQDNVYQSYKFPWNFNGIKNKIRTAISKTIILVSNSEKGLLWLRKKTNTLESRTDYYKMCVDTLKEVKPDVVYNTSQRSVLAIAPVEAAKALGINTVGFIFSWDNVPKSTLEVVTDMYHVWSEHMKLELLDYHPFIKEEKVKVTGTPQFEPHFNKHEILTRTDFYETYQLKQDYNYFCFSGDDITTSPQDDLYLRDVAQAIKELRDKGHKVGLIFRRCPVDFSDRYNKVLRDFSDIITPIEPLWEEFGGQWNQIFPTAKDGILLANLAEHCIGVINLGSSMVFDFASHNKPCAYVNYHYDSNLNSCKGVHVYKYVHFRSQPSKEAVIWLNSPNMELDLLKMISEPNETTVHAKAWFQHINTSPFEMSSDRILKALLEK
ncbi:UDP-glycosyltransferase [Winogradskyella litoriviva]|uniref:UDP-glycosyltransferase n=1 Tax=Winogradskyella litoriviva TaxID=1220182 RepID=A0ABX2E409_9FLAO|nr:UDP-glycosyltransferase [Winogradskyella litoriviva]NRD22822.1 UDP-glycosyltransferase [Winogradskyella litoriviva]